MSPGRWTKRIRLVGAGGEEVDLTRTIASHGLVSLPPMRPYDSERKLEVTLRPGRGTPRTVHVVPSGRGHATVSVEGRAPEAAVAAEIVSSVKHILRLDEDLSPFYEIAATDEALAWATRGAGRMIRSQTVFEDIVKTICTTNCAWSATERMVAALVRELGEPARETRSEAPWGRAFPTPDAMASADVSFYRDELRTGYRGPYLIAFASAVADGSLDVEAWGRASADELPDDVLAEDLLALPGVGPYAASHIMMMMGRYSRLIFDSWTRPTYARLVGRKLVKDTTIERRFRRYGRFAGLAFWLFLTEGWVKEDLPTG